MDKEKQHYKVSMWKERTKSKVSSSEYTKKGFEVEAPNKEDFDKMLKKTLSEYNRD